MVLLTRKDILKKADEREEVYIPLLDEKISLRKLTDGEYASIEAIRKDVGKITTNISTDARGGVDVKKAKKKVEQGIELELDLKKTEEMNFYADCLTAAYGLSNKKEQFSPSDLEGMRPIGVVAQISDAVLKISKLDEPDEINEAVEEFREEE